MGADKARLEVDGRRLVTLVARRLEAICPTVLVAPGDRMLPDLAWDRVDDRIAGAGPLAGIIGGLATATTPLVAVVAVDMPDCSTEVLLGLAAHWHGQPAVVPAVDGRPQPLHAIYATAAMPAFAELFDAGERSPTSALRRVDAAVIAVDGPAAWARSLNTPADLARLRERGR